MSSRWIVSRPISDDPSLADERVDVRVEQLSVGHLAVRLDRMLTKEFHGEVPDRDRGLVGRTGLGEPEPHMALMLLGDGLRALFSVVGPRALAPTVLVRVYGRVSDSAFPDPFDDVRHFSCLSVPPTRAALVSRLVSKTSHQGSPLGCTTHQETVIYLAFCT